MNSNHTTGAEIVFEEVTKRYSPGSQPAVDALSLTVPAGEFVMFVGPSGCGKTTSLKMVNRLIEPTAGRILVGGENVREKNLNTLRRQIGYVIQGGSLFPHMTVAQNIGLVPGLLKWGKARTRRRADELLDMVGLDPSRYRDRYPRELSGGQQQRVGVARGLAADPPVILMDEPFGAVDPITRQRLQDEMIGIQAELGKTVVCVTHDIDEAIKLGDRILILREGARIAQYDTPENVLAAPADEFVEDFVGSGSALKQLTLTRVEDARMERRPTAHVGEPVTEVRHRVESAGERSVVLLDEWDRPVGWVHVRGLRGDHVAAPSADLTVVDRRATLHDAMDVMLSSSHGGTIVVDRDGTYAGVATFDTVTDHLRAAHAEAEEVGR
ncbi:ABC transporter ATP-binding protein [Kytococcus sp. Marseille-QA3725]